MPNPGKTLVFGFDGTGNAPADVGGFRQDESISNILKLHILLGGGIEPQPALRTPSGRVQFTHYYNGIGTRLDGATIPLLGRLYSAGRRAVNLAFAPTFSDGQAILAEASADLADAYQPGDRIVVFGFSRGAALARKFVTALLEADDRRTVAFLGVFDTVTAMSVPLQGDVALELGTLHERVQQAVHVVAIDEDRVAFEPTLMQLDGAGSARVSETWFAGVHGDIGGGFWHDGLSDWTLAYMLRRCRLALGPSLAVTTTPAPSQLRVSDGAEIAIDDVALEPRFAGPLHVHTGLNASLYERGLRNIIRTENGTQSLPRLHYSVKLRVDRLADYRPAALRDLDFRLALGDGRLSPPIHGIGGLRRYRLPIWWRLRNRRKARRNA